MTISLLHIVVPTILVLVVLIAYMNSRNKRVMKEIGSLRTQLEKLDNASELPVKKAEPVKVEEPEALAEETVLIEEEKEDAAAEITEPEASKYNTGKSGKIYTKEELELLIKE